MAVGRRRLLAGWAAWLACPGLARSGPPGPETPPWPPPPARPASLLDRMMGRIPPRLEMVCPQTEESWTGWFFDAGTGRYDQGALESLDWFLRDWREGIRVRICVRLYWALAAASHDGALAGGRGRIELLSGYRTPRTNAALPGAARDSMHMYGRAVDFRIDGVGTARLAAYMERMQVGGVGRYDGTGFVHIDSGRLRRWRVEATR